MIQVNVRSQLLTWTSPSGAVRHWPISTAANGIGQCNQSGQTPQGLHYISHCIGLGLPSASVFVGRRWTGELFSNALALQWPKRDWILGRILWLKGSEPGVNRGWDHAGRHVDTWRRYIYIHGTNEVERLGEPCSHGCIRMAPLAIVELAEQVKCGTQVCIDGSV
mgnify:CR=1 FL=1